MFCHSILQNDSNSVYEYAIGQGAGDGGILAVLACPGPIRGGVHGCAYPGRNMHVRDICGNGKLFTGLIVG